MRRRTIDRPSHDGDGHEARDGPVGDGVAEDDVLGEPKSMLQPVGHDRARL